MTEDWDKGLRTIGGAHPVETIYTKGMVKRPLYNETQVQELLAARQSATRTPFAQLSPFQGRVAPWMQECFGPEISADVVERNHRFIEESLELVQATGCTASEAHQLVDYVFGRPQGVAHQEAGGVMVTLAALCLALGLDMHAAGEDELARIWTKIEKIRAKQAAKPAHSPLPEARSDDTTKEQK